MRLLGCGVVGLFALGCHASHGATDASPDPVDSAGGFVPTEAHALGLNDVSMLFVLPEDITATTIARMTGVPGATGELVPRDLFDRLVTVPGDVGHEFEQFHLVALRFDLCDRLAVGPCPDDADGELRLVFQPVSNDLGRVSVHDVALHAFYRVPNADLAPVVNELRALARLREFQTASPLAVNDTVRSTSPPSEYRQRLRALIAHYASGAAVLRLTLFAQDATKPPFEWIFRGLVQSGADYTDIAIPDIGAPQQRALEVDWPAPPSFTTTPIGDAPAGLQLAIDGPAFAAATPVQRQAALHALAVAQNPTMQVLGTEQCVACHVATFLGKERAVYAGIDPTTIADTYTSSRPLSVAFGISQDSATSLRAFGWTNWQPAISQRVANESAMVLDEVDQRFPPAGTTILPDAGIDTPPAVKRVFVVSAMHDGDLKTAGSGTSGLDGGDRLCSTAAANGHLGGEWVAWLSTGSINALDRLTGDGPWYLVDGTTLVFPTKAAIAGNPLAPINLDEHATQLAGPENVWTGTTMSGAVATGQTCADWTSNASADLGMEGLRSQSDPKWTMFGAGYCNNPNQHLYCFER